MVAPVDIYPLSTKDGKHIPLDVVSPTGVLVKSFTPVASSAIALPDTTDLIAVVATEDCYINFANSSAVVPADGTHEPDQMFLPKNFQTILYPINRYMSVISANANNGVLRMNFFDTWHSLALASQFVSM